MTQKIPAQKIEMSQIFLEDGTVVPVTSVKLEQEVEFEIGELVNVIGISKGKGFAGVVKRWSFAGGPKTHGQSNRVRAPGSIGGGTDPGRVWKGKKMPGHMGHQRVTVKNLKIMEQKKEGQDNIILLKGAVPGHRSSPLVLVRNLPIEPSEKVTKE